jgi:hypothetical protein
VEQLLVLQRCRALVTLHLTFAGQMVAALVPLRSLTGLTQLRLTGLPRESIANHIFLRDLARIKPLRLRDLALDCVHVIDMYAVWMGGEPSPYPPTLTRLELSRSRRTGGVHCCGYSSHTCDGVPTLTRGFHQRIAVALRQDCHLTSSGMCACVLLAFAAAHAPCLVFWTALLPTRLHTQRHRVSKQANTSPHC